MSIEIHTAESRGHADHGWLKTFHSFSFANYYNADRMGFGALRVLNDDRIDGGTGFGAHPHKDMEIVSIPLEGTLRHEDSAGNQHVIQKGDLQIMSAGTGIVHSEFNDSKTEPAAFLQIWIIPNQFGLKPSSQQAKFSWEDQANQFLRVISPKPEGSELKIHQDASFYLCRLEQGAKVSLSGRAAGRGLYVFLIEGSVQTKSAQSGEEFQLSRRDAAAYSTQEAVEFMGLKESQILAIELPLELESASA